MKQDKMAGLAKFARLTIAALTAAGALAAATGASAQSVVVYSAVSPKVMEAFVDEFQKQNVGVKVDLISGGSGEFPCPFIQDKTAPWHTRH